MNDDDLERSIRALREEGDRPAPQARLTRERILADLRPKVRRRRAIWMIPLAALLAGSTVLAATGRLPDAFHAAARALGLEAPREEPKKDTARLAGTKPSAAAQSAGPPEEAIVPPAPSSAEPATTALANDQDERSGVVARADAGVAKRSARRTAHAGSSTAGASAVQTEPAQTEATTSAGVPPPGTASAGADDQGTLALYRRARQLHFVEQKPAAALGAWDAYLAAEPRGPLSVDARYARALCLVRLGRKQEARVALEPFAAGKFGTYRQSEARALLDAMP